MKLKLDNQEVEIRVDKPSEPIEFYAHSGECKYCSGVVKMYRDTETFKIQLNNCRCLLCGQPYHVDLKPNQTVEDFEYEQWKQKDQTFAMGGD